MSPWRRALETEMTGYRFEGKVLDIGGDERSAYLKLLKGEHSIEIVNIDPGTGAHHVFDVETRFPLASGTYDAVLGINVMEHLYDHKAFLSECRRVMKDNGELFVAVPFLMQVHPSPHDYFRYTEESLAKLLADAGFSGIQIRALGKGPFTAAAHVVYNVLAKIPFLASIHLAVCRFLDGILTMLDKKGTFGVSRYPLGYIVTARK